MHEGHGAVGAAARLGIDQLSFAGGKVLQLSGQVIGHEAEVVDAFAASRQESRDSALLVDRLDQLDPRRRLRTGGQEAQTDTLRREDDRIGLGGEPEELPVARQGCLD